MDEKAEIAGRDATLVEQVMQAIRQRIAARTLGPGARLPSIRSFAATMQVSKSTIVEAYDRLAAEGTIKPRLRLLCCRAYAAAVAGGDRPAA